MIENLPLQPIKLFNDDNASVIPKSENFENKYTVDHVMYVVLNFPCSYRNLQ